MVPLGQHALPTLIPIPVRFHRCPHLEQRGPLLGRLRLLRLRQFLLLLNFRGGGALSDRGTFLADEAFGDVDVELHHGLDLGGFTRLPNIEQERGYY